MHVPFGCEALMKLDVSYSITKKNYKLSRYFVLPSKCKYLWCCKIFNQKSGVRITSYGTNLALKVGLVPIETTPESREDF